MTEYRVPTTEKVGELITANADLLEKHGVSAGLAANRPASSAAGKYYFSTDTKKWSRDNGTTWDDLQGGLSEAEVQALIDSSIGTHAADTSTHGAADIADVSDIAVDANLSAAAQAAIAASHPAPSYDAVNKEVVFQI